jgi:hypothetical protein
MAFAALNKVVTAYRAMENPNSKAARGRAEAGHVHGRKTGLLDEARAQGVGRPRGHHQGVFTDALLQGARWTHDAFLRVYCEDAASFAR